MSGRNTWSPRNIYLYTVCLITLVIAIFATVNLVRAAVELVYPEPQASVYEVLIPSREPGAESPEAPEVVERQLVEQREIQRQWSIRSSILKLVGSVTMLLVALPLYVYHWRKIEKEPAAGTPSRESSQSLVGQ